jgi:hypothetical protein
LRNSQIDLGQLWAILLERSTASESGLFDASRIRPHASVAKSRCGRDQVLLPQAGKLHMDAGMHWFSVTDPKEGLSVSIGPRGDRRFTDRP